MPRSKPAAEPSKTAPFIVESRPTLKHPWTRAAIEPARTANFLHGAARNLWGAERSERPYVRVRRFDSNRAVSSFRGGVYAPQGENARFGWVRDSKASAALARKLRPAKASDLKVTP